MIVSKACLAGLSARPRSLPRYDDRTAAPAKIVTARPQTIWVALHVIQRKGRVGGGVITRNAWIGAIAAPASAATRTAAVSTTAESPCTRWTAQKPITAPT